MTTRLQMRFALLRRCYVGEVGCQPVLATQDPSGCRHVGERLRYARQGFQLEPDVLQGLGHRAPPTKTQHGSAVAKKGPRTRRTAYEAPPARCRTARARAGPRGSREEPTGESKDSGPREGRMARSRALGHRQAGCQWSAQTWVMSSQRSSESRDCEHCQRGDIETGGRVLTQRRLSPPE